MTDTKQTAWKMVPLVPTQEMLQAVWMDEGEDSLERWYDLMVSAAPSPVETDKDEIIRGLKTENEKLRSIVSECAAALTNGAYCAPSASVEFMAKVPNEIRLVCAGLPSKSDEIIRELVEALEKLDKAASATLRAGATPGQHFVSLNLASISARAALTRAREAGEAK
jgi:hypothetical protein